MLLEYKRKPTKKENDMLEILKKYKQWGVDPGTSDVAMHADISISAARQRLDKLCELGYAERYRFQAGRAWVYRIKENQTGSNNNISASD